MVRTSFLLAFGIIICLHQPTVKAFPPMNLRKLYESADGKLIREDSSLPQPDEDVLELEQLKQLDPSNNYDAVNHEDALPALQKQLEAEATKSAFDLGQREEEEPTVVQYRPKAASANPKPLTTSSTTGGNFEKPSTKSFYGAARLAFGQNPEIITTTSTTTTSSSTTSATPTVSVNSPTVSTATLLSTSSKQPEEDTFSSELEATKNGERRSINTMPLKTAETLMNHKDGQYSSFDMAQYVFWTGDEAGVARAVEEFIQQGLMSRESAIKFLKDIRIGIEYLQKSYNNRIFPTAIKAATSDVSGPIVSTTPPAHAAAGSLGKHSSIDPENPNSAANLQKAFQNLPSLFRLQEINSLRNKDNNIDYDEVAGRMRLADFLYAEYSLEEVIYQLAKVMFSQSLTHGSEQSQRGLQHLTEFLETEGEQGRISPALQKKILDVLLAALSDTLAEHPELHAAARSGLGSAFYKLQQSNLEHLKH